MPRNEIPVGIFRVSYADVPKRIDDAFVGENAVGDGEFMAQSGECVGNGFGLSAKDGNEAKSGIAAATSERSGRYAIQFWLVGITHTRSSRAGRTTVRYP